MAIAVVRRRSPGGRRIARGSQLFGALVASAVAVVALAAASLLHPVGSTATLSLVVASLLGLPFAEPTTAPAVPEPTPSGPAPSGVVTTPEPGGSSPTPTPDAQTLLDTARRRSAEGAYDEAVTHYRAFLSLYPEDARQLDARVELGRLLVDRGEAEAALPVLQEPLDGEPDEPHRSRLAFLLGRALQQLDRAPEAEARYRQAAESSDLLAPYAWVRVGVSALTRGDAAVASAAAERVLAAPAPPAQRREALEVLASASVLRGDLEAGLDALRQVAEMASGSERAGVLLRLAELLDRAGDRGEAVDVARRVVVEHPQSVAAPRALDLLHDLGASDAVSYAEAGLVRYGERSYDRAIANFDAYLAQQPDGPQAPQARYYRAMALDVQGAWEAAVAGFRELAERHPQSAWAPQGLYVAGRIFEERGDDGSAQAFYTWVLERWPASPVATDARFRLGLLQYVHGDAAGAIATWEPLTDLREEWARALLWMGKALDRMGRRDEAVAAWEQVASGPPTAYETWRARDLLADVRYPEQRLQPGGMNADQAAPPGLADPPADLDDPHVRRAVELVAVGLWDEASSEIEAALQGWSAPASVLGDLVVWLQSQGLHHLALRGAALERSDADESVRERLEAVARGVPYASLIEAAAAEEGLDPHLLAGLVRQESAFNPRAVSPARAVGLTQVMPSTGSEIAEKLDWPDYRSDDLLRPEVSLRFGAWYLARALERYDGRLFPSLAAYNAGPGTVDGWMERFGYDDPDVFVERVPWREPAQYIRKVYAWYRTFQESASPVPSADAP